MSYIFFSLAIFAIMYELMIVMNTRKVSKFITNMKHKKGSEYNKEEKVFAFLLLCYFIWGMVGLITSQWVLFLAMFIIGIITPNKYIVTRWINAFISFLLLTFMLINKFHLHIDLGNYLISLIR